MQFLKKAVEVLCQCRQTLMYTYAFAFYLKRNNHSIIFEDNQADLEIAVEKLSGYLEREITSDNAVDTKQKVQDKYRYCEQRRKVLLDHVHELSRRELLNHQDCMLNILDCILIFLIENLFYGIFKKPAAARQPRVRSGK